MRSLSPSAPQSSEYDSYYSRYISLVPQGDIVSLLAQQAEDTAEALSQLSERAASFRYAPGKWTIKQVLGHVIDCERVFAYRALRIARDDRTPLEGFEQDDYVVHGPFAALSLAQLVEEFTAVRRATVLLFRHLTPDVWDRRGSADNKEMTVRGAAYIIAGHELHHRRILEEKYLSASGETGKAVGNS